MPRLQPLRGWAWAPSWLRPQAATHRHHLASLQGELWGEAVGDGRIVPVLPLDLPVPHRLVLEEREINTPETPGFLPRLSWVTVGEVGLNYSPRDPGDPLQSQTHLIGLVPETDEFALQVHLLHADAAACPGVVGEAGPTLAVLQLPLLGGAWGRQVASGCAFVGGRTGGQPQPGREEEESPSQRGPGRWEPQSPRAQRPVLTAPLRPPAACGRR